MNSAKDPNTSSYKIYMYLHHDANHEAAVHQILTNQLEAMQSAGLPSSMECLDAIQVHENST